LTYAEIWLTPAPSAQLPSDFTQESVNFTVKAPPGISLVLPKTFSFLVSHLITKAFTYYTLLADTSVAPGDYSVTLTASYGSATRSISFVITVVPNLITLSFDTYSPNILTTKAGSTVYWINVDTDDREVHQVDSTTGIFRSPVLLANPDYSSWSYTFTTPGTYHYSDDYTAGMVGTIVINP